MWMVTRGKVSSIFKCKVMDLVCMHILPTVAEVQNQRREIQTDSGPCWGLLPLFILMTREGLVRQASRRRTRQLRVGGVAWVGTKAECTPLSFHAEDRCDPKPKLMACSQSPIEYDNWCPMSQPHQSQKVHSSSSSWRKPKQRGQCLPAALTCARRLFALFMLISRVFL